MGADGHVIILDADKVDKYKESPEQRFCWYRYNIFGKRLYVAYYGDSPSGLEAPPCLFCGSLDYDACEHWDKNKDIQKECLIAEWEVWT